MSATNGGPEPPRNKSTLLLLILLTGILNAGVGIWRAAHPQYIYQAGPGQLPGTEWVTADYLTMQQVAVRESTSVDQIKIWIVEGRFEPAPVQCRGEQILWMFFPGYKLKRN